MNEQENVIVSENSNGKSKGKIGIIAIILAVVLIGIGGFLYYRSVILKNPIKFLIHNTLSYMEKNIKEPQSGIGTFSFKVSGSSSNNSINEVFSIIDKIGINGYYGIDYKNKLIDVGINTSYDNNKIVNANIYYENGKGYVDLEDLFDKYISVPVENYDKYFNNDNYEDNYKTFLHSIDKALDDTLKDEYFEKEKVSLDGKNVVKTTLHLDSKNYDTIKKELFNRLIEDNKFVESVASISEKSTKDVIDSLEKARDNDDEFKEFDISIYTKGFKWIQIELSNSSDKVFLKNADDKKLVSLYKNDILLYDIIIENKIVNSKENYVISISDKEQKYSLTINMDFSFDEGKSTEKKDVSNSVDIKSISKEEMQSISTKILQNKGLINLIQEISTISNN